MCGIVGAISNQNIVPHLIEGLSRLEYRGYDSSGIAVLRNGIERIRSVGRVAEIETMARDQKLEGFLGIGHTRWATHGGVTEFNAHPHISNNQIAVVHNGIIENYEEEREKLIALGYSFESQTDTEVIAHLIHYYVNQKNKTLLESTQMLIDELTGAFAIAVISLNNPDEMICARLGCPLILGLGDTQNFIASDISALLAITKKVIYLEDGDVVQVKKDDVQIFDKNKKSIIRKVHTSDVTLSSMELGQFDHFMQKEIYEQPRAITDTIEGIIDGGYFDARLFGSDAEEVFANTDSILILAAGTSYYAGVTAKYWLESIAKIKTSVEISSEYRYRDSVPNPKQLVIAISQSGETLDTLEALKHAQSLGHDLSLAICNVQESAIARASRLVFYTRAGAEISVASTKACTTQLVSLFSLAVTLAH
ncbi:MAG: glutamine--fructose-6-phosphate transaminase (isomerizing), partial [Methylophilaceae bacterium]|nr:glutamine--fructose-6-phosphate transaminase (isomerizing) [Methylophilaceae bacterium]